jgi:hypothetical protein
MNIEEGPTKVRNYLTNERLGLHRFLHYKFAIFAGFGSATFYFSTACSLKWLPEVG